MTTSNRFSLKSLPNKMRRPCSHMSIGGGQEFLHENRFTRMDFTTLPGVLKTVPPALLTNEKTHYEPANGHYTSPTGEKTFLEVVTNDGGADCICASVTGLPVSIFKDVQLQATIEGVVEQFPLPVTAATSLDVNTPPNLPIGGTEEPHMMFYDHRADSGR